MSNIVLWPKFVPEYEIGNDISVYTCHVERSAPVMSSVVETSLNRFLHSLRSVGMTISVNMYIVPMK